MPKINRIKIVAGRQSRKLQELKNISINIHINHIKEEMEEKKEETNFELDELIDEVKNIKTKRTILYWVADNKEYINDLDNTSKNILMNEIKIRFFNN